MGFFNKKSEEKPIFKTSYLGYWIKVYADRVECNPQFGKQSIPISQIASVSADGFGWMSVTIETTGGKRYLIPCLKKKEAYQAILDVQRKSRADVNKTSIADELEKLYALKERGVITEEEFNEQKRKLL